MHNSMSVFFCQLSLSFVYIYSTKLSVPPLVFCCTWTIDRTNFINGPRGSYGSFSTRGQPFPGCARGLWAVSKDESFPRFILPRGFRDILLVVSILAIVYIAICGRIYSPEEVKSNFENDLKFLRKKNLHKIVLGHINVTSIRK